MVRYIYLIRSVWYKLYPTDIFQGILQLKSFLLAVGQHADTSGPVFIQEPPNQVDFSNTTGMEVICQSRGTPLPRITWVRQDGHKWVVAEDVPGLRQVSDR